MEPPDPAGTGAILRELRHLKRRSLTQMAAELRVSKGYLSAVEIGREKVSDRVIQGYADVLGLEMLTLIAALDAARFAVADKPRFGLGIDLRSSKPRFDQDRLATLTEHASELNEIVRKMEEGVTSSLVAIRALLERQQDVIASILSTDEPR